MISNTTSMPRHERLVCHPIYTRLRCWPRWMDAWLKGSGTMAESPLDRQDPREGVRTRELLKNCFLERAEAKRDGGGVRPVSQHAFTLDGTKESSLINGGLEDGSDACVSDSQEYVVRCTSSMLLKGAKNQGQTDAGSVLDRVKGPRGRARQATERKAVMYANGIDRLRLVHPNSWRVASGLWSGRWSSKLDEYESGQELTSDPHLSCCIFYLKSRSDTEPLLLSIGQPEPRGPETSSKPKPKLDEDRQMPHPTNEELNAKRDEHCIAVTHERLLPSEWQKHNDYMAIPLFNVERVLNEGACLRFLAENTDIPLPQLYARDEDHGAAYLITEYVEGVGMNVLDVAKQETVAKELELTWKRGRLIDIYHLAVADCTRRGPLVPSFQQSSPQPTADYMTCPYHG
ncbi:hypothetical protein ACRALDRAFT_2018649 [Sodiomyces alcalophilus JCM 7366]|uniref:uncharacterized protein n=1 Tax=Sodiomyces alcalophilus JCM 7366 TaxID=591952 RepID=UPI0039B44F3E